MVCKDYKFTKRIDGIYLLKKTKRFEFQKITSVVLAFLLIIELFAGLFFSPLIQEVQASVKTWDGGGADATCGGAAGDGNKWSCDLNWSDDAAPTSVDVATFDGTSIKDAIIDANINVAGIEINKGYTGTLTLERSLTITGDITLASGTFNADDQTLTIGGSWTNQGAEFLAGTSTVVFNDASIISNITGDNIFYNFTCLAPGKTIVFQTGTLTTIQNTLTIEGASGNNVILNSSLTGEGNEFKIYINAVSDAQGNPYAEYITVNDSDALGPIIPIPARNESIAGRNNTNWDATYYWVGGAGSWADSNHWSGSSGGSGGAGVPSSSDNVIFDSGSGTGTVTLDQARSLIAFTISTNNIIIDCATYTLTISGNADFSAGTINNGQLTVSAGTSNAATFSGATFGANATAASGAIYLNGSTFNGTSSFTQTGSVRTTRVSAGGNTFNSTTTITISGLDSLSLASTNADIFNADATFNNNSSRGTLSIAYTASGTQFNGNITVNSLTGGRGTYLGANGGTSTLASGKTITASGTLSLEGFTQNGSTAQTITLTGITDVLYLQSGTTFNGNVIFTAPSLTLSGATFNGTADLTKNGSLAEISAGGNTFNSTTTITNSGTGSLTLANASQDTFNGDVTFVKSESGAFTVGYGAYANTFAGNVTVTNTNGTVTFGNGAAGGTCQFTKTSGTQILSTGGSTIPILTHTGAGTLQLSTNALAVEVAFTNSAGIFDANGLATTVTGLATLSGGTYSASTATQTFNGGLTISGGTFTGSSGAVDVNGNLTLSSGTFTQSTSALNVSGDFSISSGATFTKATAGQPLTFDGTGNLSDTNLDGSKQDLGAVTIGGSSTTRTLTGAVKMTSLAINSGNTFALAGNNFSFSSAAAVSNSGTFRLQGVETLSNVNNLGISSGTVEYVGDNTGSTYTIKEFGTTDYYNLIINDTNATKDTFRTNGNLTIAGALNVTSGSLDISTNANALSATGTLTVDGGTLTATAGTIDANGAATISSGILTAPNGNFAVAGDWTYQGGTFTHSSGTVTLDGTNQALFGATTFYNFTKSVISADILTFPAGAGNEQTILGALTLTGASGQLLSLRSSSSPTQWRIDPQGARSVSYVDVKDSNNINATAIIPVDFINSGNNTNWTFNIAPAASTGGPWPQDRHIWLLYSPSLNEPDDFSEDQSPKEEAGQEQQRQEQEQQQTPSSASTTVFVFAKNLAFGSRGIDVVKIQDKLKELGFFPQDVPSIGHFGLITKQAVMKYQESVGIYPCGIVGPRTRKALNGEEFISNNDYQFTQDLQYGSSGEEVKQLQTRLRDQNFFPYNVPSTGWFGRITQAAVRLFQQFYHLSPNGIVDKLTRAALNR